MSKYDIAWLSGDGIGPEVTEATKTVLDSIGFKANYIPAEIGWECFEKYGTALPQETINILHKCSCAFLGAITSKPLVKGYISPIISIRQMFDLYAAVRECKTYDTTNYQGRQIDLVIFRENTEDLYRGIEYSPIPESIKHLPGLRDLPEESAISLRLITKKGSERIIKAAFDYAVKKGREKVTCVHKANVLRLTDGLFLNTFKEISKSYPNIKTSDENVDATAMWLVKDPYQYDIIVTTNMFGDILSDEAAQLVGGLGMVPSANIGHNFALFEPSHGSAPKYAGQLKVNPIASILAAKAMLEWLKETKLAAAIEKAVAAVISEGRVKTYDLGGTNSTMEVADAISKKAVEHLAG